MSASDESPFSDQDPVLSGLEPGFLVGGGRYSLRRVIARGPASTVWLATDAQLGEDLALKFYRSEIATDSPLVNEIRRKAQQSRRLSHPNIIRIHDVFHTPGELLFIAMEYVDGMNLGDLRLQQADQAFAWHDFKPLAEHLCAALEYAHGEGLVHGNVKPSNLILDSRGRLRLADFGLQVVPPEVMRKLSGEDFDAATLPYLSPQRLEGDAPTVSDDLYAAGATIYCMLAGNPPFWTGDVRHQIRNAHPQALGERLHERGLGEAAPGHIAALVMACLAKDPAQRPANASALLEWVHAEETIPAPEEEVESERTLDENEPISLIPPEEEPPPARPLKKPGEEEFADPWKGESEEKEEKERISVRDWVAAHSISVAVVTGLLLVMLGYYWGAKQQETRAMREARQNAEWVAEQIALDAARRERRQKGKLIMVGPWPQFSHRYQPREALVLDTNAVNTNVRFWSEGPGRGNCCFLTPAGATNDARGTILYEFESEPGYLINEMMLEQSSAIYTRGSVEGEYSTDRGETYTSFYSTPPFRRGAHAGHAERAVLRSLNATNILIRYTLYRFEREEYNIQFLRDCDDAPATLEITGTVLSATR